MSDRQPRQPRKPAPRKPIKPTKKKAAASLGMPALAIALAAALLVGGVGGYLIARIHSPSPQALAQAQARVAELENTVEMMGYQVGEGADDSAFFLDEELNDFGGSEAWGEEGEWENGAWNEDGLLGGMLAEGGDDTVVAEFTGGTLTLGEVAGPYNEALAGSALEFAAVDDDAEARLDEVMRQLVTEKVTRQKAEEMGLTTLTEADQQAIRAEAEAAYEDYLITYSASVDTAGMSEADARAAVEAFVATEVGFTLDGLIAEYTEDYWLTKLRGAVTADVAVTDEEVQTEYDRLLQEQKQRFAESTAEYEASVYNDMIIAWNPEGYRRVKHILLPFADSEKAAQAEALNAQIQQRQSELAEVDEILALQAELDALYTDLDAQAETVLAELSGGLDFDEAILRYGRDPDMLREPGKTRGYCVSADSVGLFSQEFIDASMTLERVGDISVPAHSTEGAHIIRYIGDVTPGAVPLEEIRDRIAAQLLEEKRDEAFAQAQAQWVADADVHYYPERVG